VSKRSQEPLRQVVDRLTLFGFDLLPDHHLQKFECLEQRPAICFVEREQIGLEFGVVEIQLWITCRSAAAPAHRAQRRWMFDHGQKSPIKPC